MGSRTICAACAHRTLLDTSAETPPDAVRVVADGGVPFCLSPDMLVNPVTGVEQYPRRCIDLNVFAACPWFERREDKAPSSRVGNLRVRGGIGWIDDRVEASDNVMVGPLAEMEVAAALEKERLKAAARPSFPPPPPKESYSSAVVISNEVVKK